MNSKKGWQFKLNITRDQVQQKIIEITKTTKDSVAVESSIESWLKSKKCPEFDMKQILNDLTSYKEYLEL